LYDVTFAIYIHDIGTLLLKPGCHEYTVHEKLPGMLISVHKYMYTFIYMYSNYHFIILIIIKS